MSEGGMDREQAAEWTAELIEDRMTKLADNDWHISLATS